MVNETLQKLYAFSEQLDYAPKWLNPSTQNAFLIPTELSDRSVIYIHVLQDGERLIYQVPFKSLPADIEQKMALLIHFMEVNKVSKVITALIDDTIYLTMSQPVTYNDNLDTQLFIEARYTIARFYDENREDLLSVEG
jgi:hypothetical protein